MGRSVSAVKHWFPRPGGDGGLLGDLFFLTLILTSSLQEHDLSLLEGCVPPADILSLNDLDASVMSEMGAYIVTCLVAIGALVHRLVKSVSEANSYEEALQAHLNDIVSKGKFWRS